MGNMLATKIPILRLSLNIPEILPTTVGPAEHPKSPANAKKANITVPPPLISEADILKVPGHNIPTENPAILHTIKPNIGQGDNEIIK